MHRAGGVVAQATVNPPSAPADRPVVLFDGGCGLCNAAVDWIMVHDRQQRFLFSPLQGQFAQGVVGPEPAGGWTSVVFVQGGQSLTQSDAALGIAGALGWPWKAALVFKAVPRPVRNAVYDWIGRNRYNWFGKKETCRLPTPAERARFLP